MSALKPFDINDDDDDDYGIIGRSFQKIGNKKSKEKKKPLNIQQLKVNVNTRN